MTQKLFTLAFCLIGLQAFAQKVETKYVPAALKTSLEKNLGIKDAKWEKEGDNYEANFKKKGKEMSAVLDATGAVLEIEEEIAQTDLPSAAQDLLKKDYAGYEIEETAKITAKGVVTFEAEVEKGKQTFKLIFDQYGKLLKKEEEKEGDDKD